MNQDRTSSVAVRLRRATDHDSEFAYRVKRTTLAEYVRRLHGRRFASQSFRVIEADGVDAGVLAATYEPDCLRVNQLLVLPKHQGKGVGTACMEHVIEDAARHDLPVRLQVLKVNPRARHSHTDGTPGIEAGAIVQIRRPVRPSAASGHATRPGAN
jgi:GNAT superfamily N-acetyltransferase